MFAAPRPHGTAGATPVLICRVSPRARDLIAGAEITAPGYIAHPGLDIGAPEHQVVRILGEPTRRTGDGLVYECGEVEQPVTFRLRNGIVTAVTIAYYVD
jgi:hypothetical protein